MKGIKSKWIRELVNTLVASRSNYFKMVRNFFDKRGYNEVDTLALYPETSVDLYIDPIVTTCGLYLHTSPECAMKRLLAQGSGDIYFLGHVYRKEEVGSLHNLEFTMIEWYKTNTDETTFIQEVIDLLALFLPTSDFEMLTFDEALARYTNAPPKTPQGWSLQEAMQLQWAEVVEPNLGIDKITIIHDFPASEAACAKTHLVNGVEKAMRFEFYFKGIELCNGFAELSDAKEQENRYIETNKARVKSKKSEIPYDTRFLKDLNFGLPPNTFGMAAGFDRLMMLGEKKENIHDVLLLSLRP